MVSNRNLGRFGELIAIIVVFLAVSASASAAEMAALDQFEKSIGESAAEELIKRNGGEYYPPLQQQLWLDEIFNRLRNVVKRDLPYSLTVLNTQDINAFALPGGYVFLTRGMLRFLSDDQHAMAAVLGHELAHIEEKHGLQAVLRQMGLTVLMEVSLLWFDAATSEDIRLASTALVEMAQAGWGREAEFAADRIGQQLAAEAGFDPAGAVFLQERLLGLDQSDLPMMLFRTHPDTIQRRRRCEQALRQYWSEPKSWQPVDNSSLGSANPAPHLSVDPLGRFRLESRPDLNGEELLQVFDEQNQHMVNWFEDQPARQPAWSPDGRELAAAVWSGSSWDIWIVDRMGRKQRVFAYEDADLAYPMWSPDGRMIAFQRTDGNGSAVVVVGYRHSGARVEFSDLEQARPWNWSDWGLIVQKVDSEDEFLIVEPPPTAEVTIRNPVPQILERKPRIAPEVIKESDTIILRRPNILQP